MNDYYQLAPVQDPQKDNSEIASILAAIKSGKLDNDLRLLNYYQSIPVNYPATIESLDKDSIELTIHQHQAVVMQLEKISFLKSSHFPKDVLASVNYVNVDKCVAVLTKFAYALIRAERRQFVRVQVKAGTQATLTTGSGSLHGMLSDISLGGIAMSVSTTTFPEANTAGTVRIALPNGTLEVPAKVLRTLTNLDPPLCIIEITPDSRAENAISQYIFQRQVEIVRELKDNV